MKGSEQILCIQRSRCLLYLREKYDMEDVPKETASHSGLDNDILAPYGNEVKPCDGKPLSNGSDGSACLF
jgi:hypothetical protein